MKTNDCQSGVLVLGYSERLEGGVSKVTALLIENMPNLTLHPILFSYSSKIRSIWETLLSLLSYTVTLLHPRKYKVVLVLVGSPGDAVRVLPFFVVARVFRKKVCIQFHKSTDVILDGIMLDVVKTLVVNAWKQVDLLCFLSEHLMEIHKEICHDNVPKVVIPNFIDNRWIDAEPLGFSERNRGIVFLGRWSREKGVEDLVEVMESIDLDVTCELYTDAPAGIARRNCTFCGWVDEDTVFDVIRSAKLLVLPSYAEAYPTVLLEACTSGTPFIATNIGGIPDIAVQSRSGILIEPGDKDGMQAAIKELLTNRDRWEDCSRRGGSWLSILSNEQIIKSWKMVYQDLLA